MSVRFLAFLARRLAAWRLLLVVSARDEELDGASGLGRTLDDLIRRRQLAPLRLGPLTRSDTLALVRALVDGAERDASTPSRLAEAVWAASEGHPLLALETLRTLDGNPMAGLSPAQPPPEALRQMIGRRLAPLDERCASPRGGRRRRRADVRLPPARARDRPRRVDGRRGGGDPGATARPPRGGGPAGVRPRPDPGRRVRGPPAAPARGPAPPTRRVDGGALRDRPGSSLPRHRHALRRGGGLGEGGGLPPPGGNRRPPTARRTGRRRPASSGRWPRSSTARRSERPPSRRSISGSTSTGPTCPWGAIGSGSRSWRRPSVSPSRSAIRRAWAGLTWGWPASSGISASSIGPLRTGSGRSPRPTLLGDPRPADQCDLYAGSHPPRGRSQ